MPRTSGGTSARVTSTYMTGNQLLPSQANADLTDIYNDLTASLDRTGKGGFLANIPAAGYHLTGLGAGSTAGDSVEYAQFQAGINAATLSTASSLAAASTTNIGAAGTNTVGITGTTTINAFDTVASGIMRFVEWFAATPVVYSSNLILIGGANRTNSAGDSSIFRSLGGGVWREEMYQPSAGNAPASYSQTFYIASNTTLTAAQSGSIVSITSGAVILPPAQSGLRFKIYGNGSGSFQSQGISSIYYPDGNSITPSTPIVASQFVTTELFSDGSNWIVTSQAGDMLIKSSTNANRPARIDQAAGISQSWQNMTGVGGRALGATIYNTTTKSIDVNITTQGGSTDTYNNTQLTIGSETYNGSTGTSRGSATLSTVYGTVPPGVGYQVNSNYPLLRWSECR